VKPDYLLRRFAGRFVLGSAAAGVLLATVTVWSGQAPVLPQGAEAAVTSSTPTEKAASFVPQPNETKKSGDETISDAAELCKLSNQLRDELGKMNVNVLSLGVIRKTRAIEELAKKIKGEANARER